jgi:hypothetical protein
MIANPNENSKFQIIWTTFIFYLKTLLEALIAGLKTPSYYVRGPVFHPGQGKATDLVWVFFGIFLKALAKTKCT